MSCGMTHAEFLMWLYFVTCVVRWNLRIDNVDLTNNMVSAQSKENEELLPDNWKLNYKNSDLKKIGFF